MSIFIVGSREWQEHAGTEQVCFLCGGTFAANEKVAHWMGCGGSQEKELPFIPFDYESLLVLDTLTKRGIWPALNIFFHVDCLPSFCRRILQDWEQVKLK